LEYQIHFLDLLATWYNRDSYKGVSRPSGLIAPSRGGKQFAVWNFLAADEGRIDAILWCYEAKVVWDSGMISYVPLRDLERVRQ